MFPQIPNLSECVCVFDWLRDQNVSVGTRVKRTLIRDCVSFNIFGFVRGVVLFGGKVPSHFNVHSRFLFIFVFEDDL